MFCMMKLWQSLLKNPEGWPSFINEIAFYFDFRGISKYLNLFPTAFLFSGFFSGHCIIV